MDAHDLSSTWFHFNMLFRNSFLDSIEQNTQPEWFMMGFSGRHAGKS
jgi:hypothetical protein